MESAVMNTYGERTTTLVKGEGIFVWDKQGRRYIDAVSGIAVCGLGHCHPAVTQAICKQADTLVHCSNLYGIDSQQDLGRALIDIAGMEKVFFSNSGAEANEAALKIARKYGNDKGIKLPTVITANGSFHGRTMATLSATANPKIKAGFSPELAGFVHVPFNDIEAIKAAASADTVAVMVEPVQGEGGIRIPSPHYLRDLRALCSERGWLMILDEIQTGNGRTGKYFAFQHDDYLPDVLTTAKGLGNGVPIGACLTAGAASTVLQPGNHGSTFGGNPLATTTGLAVVKELNKPELLAHVGTIGGLMLNLFKERLSHLAGVKDIRGRGLMLGIELDRDCPPLVDMAKQEGLLINVTAGSTIRLLPPLIIEEQYARSVVTTLCTLIETFLEK